MGKDLKGKEIGKGLSQRNDKKYLARFTDKNGKRHNFINASLIECKKWLIECEDSKECLDKIKVKDWYEYWIGIKNKKIKETSVNEYEQKWKLYIEPYVGNKYMDEVTYMDFEKLFMDMDKEGYSKTTIKHIKGIFNNMFKVAVKKDVILKNPLSLSECDMGAETEIKEALTVEEQKKFVNACKGNSCEFQFRFLLQTGLRISELVGLKWEDVDFKNKTLKVERQLKVVRGEGWKFLTPKSKTGKRTIYLTQEAIKILELQKAKNECRKVINIEWKDLIFSSKKCKPISNTNYNHVIYDICRKSNIRKISTHILRHTFATRCIENGMQPKTLQILLGHSDISITMNRYVTTTDDFKKTEIEKIQDALNVI